jgi:hypothetical protein
MNIYLETVCDNREFLCDVKVFEPISKRKLNVNAFEMQPLTANICYFVMMIFYCSVVSRTSALLSNASKYKRNFCSYHSN